MKIFYVYIIANKRNGTLYVGVTSDLKKRIWQHKDKEIEGFTTRYGVDKLVWYEEQENAESAIQREKQIKKWHRTWKMKIIEQLNPEWNDLYSTVME